MTTTRTRLLYILISFTIGYLPMGASPVVAQQEDCKVIVDAAIKVLNTPTHMYITGKVGATTVNTEMIYAGGAVYMRIDGKWSAAGTTKEIEQMMQKKQTNSKATCHYLKDDLVSGEMAALYSLHSPGLVESQIWISKAKGLTLRQEDDIGAAGKQHNSTRYEYGNVKPPL